MSAERAPESDIEELVRRVLAGDTDAFEHIVERHEAEVWRVVAAALSDRNTTENVVQQSFVSAYESLGRFTPGRDFGAWIRGIARNLVRDELRRSARESRRMSHYREYLLKAYEDDEAAHAEEEQLARTLGECRKGLAPTAAQALSLFYEDDLSLEQVAAAIGRTMVATRQLLFRTRASLRACVESRLAHE